MRSKCWSLCHLSEGGDEIKMLSLCHLSEGGDEIKMLVLMSSFGGWG